MQRTRAFGWRRIILEAIPIILLILFVAIDQISKVYFRQLFEENSKEINLLYVINSTFEGPGV